MGNVARRDILAGGIALAAAPLAAIAADAKRVRRIGMLSGGTSNAAMARWSAQLWRDALASAGYEEGRNLVVERRYADGHAERLDGLARELVRERVELIVAGVDTDSALAAKRATRTIPIVMNAVSNPVETGLVDSLARPGGNVTGTSWGDVEVVERLFQILREAMPAASRIAALRDPTLPDARLYMDAYRRAASALGMSLHYAFATRPEDVAQALAQVASARPDAMIVAGNPSIRQRMAELASFVAERRIFTVSVSPDYVIAGAAVLCYSADFADLTARTVSYVDRILGGAKPGDLPVELPSKYQLIFNAKVARAIGYTLPASLQVRVDRVVE